MAPHSRRRGTGTGRRSHSHSNFDATNAGITNYGEYIDASMIGAWQLPPGSIGNGKIASGGLDGSIVITEGTLTPETFDTTPPAVPTALSLTSDSVIVSDGASMVRLILALTHATDTDLLGCVVQVTRDYTGTEEVLVPDWTYPSEHFLGRDNTTLIINGVMGASQHWVRVRSRDIQGNESDWATTLTVQSADDSTAPSVPENLTAIAGFRGVVLKWGRVADTDLSHYVVRFCQDDGADAPDNAWTEIQSLTNILWINNLTPDQKYWFDVSAVDRSGNASSEATSISAVPEMVGANSDDLAAGSVTTVHIDADGINANVIKTGLLAIEAGAAGRADGIRIYDVASDNPDGLVGRWDENGLLIYETNDFTRYVKITSAAIELWIGDHLTTAITPDGIDANAILFGRMPGGQNMIPNSSFEVGAFPTEVPYAHTGFTAGAAATNATYSGGTITITTLP